MFEKKSVCTALGFVSTEHEDESKSIGARISNMEFVPFHLNPADTNVKGRQRFTIQSGPSSSSLCNLIPGKRAAPNGYLTAV